MAIEVSEDGLLDLDEGARGALAESIIKDYDAWKSQATDLIGEKGRWNLCYKNFKCVSDPNSHPFKGAPDIFVPTTQIQVLQTVPRIMKAYFGKTPWINLVAGSKESVPYIERTEALLQYQLEVEAQFEETARHGVFSKCLYGAGVYKIPYAYETRKRRWHEIREQDAGEMQKYYEQTNEIPNGYVDETMEEEVASCDGPKPVFVRLDDFPIDYGTIDNIQEARWCGMKFRRWILELEEMEKEQRRKDGSRFFYPKALAALKGTPGSSTIDRQRETAIGANAQSDPDKKPKEILEAWRWYKGKKIMAWVHIGTKTLLRAVPHPYGHGLWPFVMDRFATDPNSPYGIGQGEMFWQLNRLQNWAVNQWCTNWLWQNTVGGRFRAGIEMDAKNIRPGYIASMDGGGPDDFKEWERKPPMQPPSEILSFVDSLVSQMGTPPVVTGNQPTPAPTATGHLKLVEEAHQFTEGTVRIGSVALNEIAYQALALMEEYMPDEKEYRVLGEPGRGEGPVMEVFKRDWLKYHHGAMIVAQASAASLSKAVEREAMAMQIDKTIQMKQVFPELAVNAHAMMDDFYKSMGNKERENWLGDPDVAIIPRQEYEQLKQIAQQTQMAAQKAQQAEKVAQQESDRAVASEDQIRALEDDLRKSDDATRIEKMKGLANSVKAALKETAKSV